MVGFKEDVKSKSFSLYVLLYKLYWRKTFNYDGIIVVSDYSKQDILVNVNQSLSLIVIPNIISEIFLKRLQNIAYENRKYLLYVGGYDERKNVQGLLAVFSNFVNKNDTELKLKISGSINQIGEELKLKYLDE
jgi:glycosyltransferase involved in cell wall biosynthesis